MYNKKKTIRNVILILSLTIIVFGIIFSLNDFKSIIDVLSKINLTYFFIAIGLVLIYFILYPISLYVLVRHRKCAISFRDVFLIGNIEHFFNGITPFATGGQPFVAYCMYKKGIKVSESTGILTMNYIIFMMVTNIYAIVSLFYYNVFTQYTSNLLWLVITGFGANFGVLLLIISFGVSKHIRNWILRFVKWLCKFKIFKKLIEPRISMLEDYMDKLQLACKELFKSPGSFIVCFLIKFIMMGIYYLLTFFIIKSIYPDLDYSQMSYVLFGTSFAITMVVWVPTPGGTGGIEYAFSTIFTGLVAGVTSIGVSGMLLWRAVTFYFIMILSFICYLLINKSIANDEKRAILLENKNENVDEIKEDNLTNNDSNEIKEMPNQND